MIGAFGVGGLLGGIGLLAVPAGLDRRRISSWFAAAYGLILVAVALDPWLWLLPGLLVFAGIAMSITNTSANTLVQTAAQPHLRGQAVSVFMLVSRGGMALGSLAMGLAVSLLGMREALLINGVLAIAAQAQIARNWLRSPK
jgi:MFS family permease